MTLFERIYRHLLPRGLAWVLFPFTQIAAFFKGLAGLPASFLVYVDLVWFDIFPDTTRELEEWESTFGIVPANMDDTERRANLDAAWKARGVQTPSQIEALLAGAGFPLTVHEAYFDPGKQLRDPRLVLDDGTGTFLVTCGNPTATCGNPDARCGAQTSGAGILLVNKIATTTAQYLVTCGNPTATCGNPDARCGARSGYVIAPKEYTIPDDSTKWPYFWYLGGASYPDFVDIPAERRLELETLVLKVKPTHTWVGLLINYV